MTTHSADWSAALLRDACPKAASFIVTVYGDIVVPRGEVLWMGSLIEICGRVGISESLVRTATSRLVAEGRLHGERDGRRSFYRLAPAARAEFAEAARLLYADEVQPERLFVLHAPNLAIEEMRRFRMARMGGDVWLCPDLGNGTPAAELSFQVAMPASAAELPALAGFWDFSDLQQRYTAMIARFRGLARAVAEGDAIAADEALICRLLLVHAYRNALLRDPCLPARALPPDWHGLEARRLFKSLYLGLSPSADRQIARILQGQDGPLPAGTPQSRMRLAALAEGAASVRMVD